MSHARSQAWVSVELLTLLDGILDGGEGSDNTLQLIMKG